MLELGSRDDAISAVTLAIKRQSVLRKGKETIQMIRKKTKESSRASVSIVAKKGTMRRIAGTKKKTRISARETLSLAKCQQQTPLRVPMFRSLLLWHMKLQCQSTRQ